MLDIAQQERIRQALLAYMQAHAIGVVKLSRRISEAHPRRPEIIVKTLQRFLAGRTVNEQMVAFCDHFVSKMPHRPTVLHELAEAMQKFYGHEQSGIEPGHYGVAYSTEGEPVSDIFIERHGELSVVKQIDKTTGYRIFDGILVSASGSITFTLKDRVMATPRFYGFRLDKDASDIRGVEYTGQTALERPLYTYATLKRIDDAAD